MFDFKRFAFTFICLTFLSSTLAEAQEKPQPIRFDIRFENRKNHYIDVDMTFRMGENGTTEVMMATWTPGSYLIREYSRHIMDISVANAKTSLKKSENEKKSSLPTIQKIKKNRWLVTASPNQEVKVSYQLYCREMSVRTNWVDEEYAMLNGAPTFLTIGERRNQPHIVKFHLPVTWMRTVVALPREGSNTNTFRAETFDILVDSPVIVGNPTIFPFEAGGKLHLFASEGDKKLWDFSQASIDVQKIVKEHQKMWGSVPYENYIFLNMLCESGGGLEHDNSTLMMTSRWSYRDRSRYLRWLGLVSHEFFHTWNVRRLKPKQLSPYDFENENYFDTLWIAEGVTSYYDDLAVMRCGLYRESEYLRALSGSIRSLESTPGRKVQSLKDSSYDTWIKYYRKDENSGNSQISYYTKGAVVAFLLDAKIRKLTNNAKSLDDVMRKMYADFANERGYTSNDFRVTTSEIAGADLTPWFKNVIDSTKELDYKEALTFYGLKFRKARDLENFDSKIGSPYMGVSASTDDGKLVVSSVSEGSCAYKAGVNVDDELIAFDDYRLSGSRWSSQLAQFKAGEKHKLTIARRGKILTLDIVLESREPSDFGIEKLKKPSDEQKAALAHWLHLPAPKKADKKNGSAAKSDSASKK